jgi:hypothetical protein
MAFDVRAALAEIKARAELQAGMPSAATPATTATNAGHHPAGVAEVAGVAAPPLRMQKYVPSVAPENDADALTAALRLHGPMTQGAAALALGWGATRAWQAEARLRAAGAVRMDAWGRAVVEDANIEKCDIIASFSNGDPAVGDGGPD